MKSLQFFRLIKLKKGKKVNKTIFRRITKKKYMYKKIIKT